VGERRGVEFVFAFAFAVDAELLLFGGTDVLGAMVGFAVAVGVDSPRSETFGIDGRRFGGFKPSTLKQRAHFSSACCSQI
jgi:hypothetical protein